MSLKGEKLAALYSYGCRKAEKLGINQLLLDFIKEGKSPDKAREGLKKLISYRWYQLIASGNHIDDSLTKEIVESYWTGNKLTNIVLFHNFTVLGGFHPKLNNLEDVESCKISLGKVLNFEKHHHDEIIIRVSSHALIRGDKNGEISLTMIEKSIDGRFVKKASKGNFITFHYNIAREILEEEKAKLLKKFTRDAINLFNEQQK